MFFLTLGNLPGGCHVKMLRQRWECHDMNGHNTERFTANIDLKDC